MFAAAISLVGLAATVYLVLREAKAIRAQSGTVAKSALGWSVVFGLFQVFLTIWGAIGLVAQNEPLAFVMPVSYTHLRAHETDSYPVCRLLLEKRTTIK